MTNEQWPIVIPEMIENFGRDPSKVGVLLELLTVLPEEVNTNHRIPIEVGRKLGVREGNKEEKE